MKTHQILFLLCLLSSPFSYIQAQALPMDQMIGTNSFVDAPMDKMEAVSFIREYHPWSFTEIEDDVFEYNRWNGFWDFDAYYTDLKQLGITVCPVLWSSPDWLEDNSENKPCDDEEDPEDPSSYTEMAQLMYQYAARYGNTVVDEEKLLVNTGQVKKSGMGVLTYYEDWNEQDRDWAGRDPKFLAEEYAAMASANVDGHGGTLGEGLGIKSADPSAKFVMGGLYILGTNYLSKMHKWFQENRPDQLWPIDVINMHHYAYTFAEHGICPEQDGYKAKVKEVIEWRDQYAPDNEVWITEFGYDTNETSQNRVDPFAGFTQQEIQAQWIVRTYLILSSVGVNRAAQFMIRDADPGSQPRWSDCGLTLSDSENYLPKTSWYYVYSLKNIMKGFYFDTVVQESPEAYVYRFVNESGDQYTYALWSPSGNGSTSQYQLEIPSEFKFRNKVQLTDGSIQGSITPIESSSNKLELELSETPVFLVADYSGPSSTREIGEAYPNLVFPNPFSETIQLRLPTLPGNPNTRIIILTPDGKQVRNLAIQHDDPNPTINLSDLKGGFYFLTARTGSKIYYKKIVKP
jgi:hypothetical protein